jgi:hypothetical protein
MKHKKFDFRTAYIDLLLNFMVSIIFLFILSSLLINPVAKKQNEGIKKNAEMLIQVDWNKDLDCDVDIWVRDPQKNVVFFAQRDRGLMHIERDDVGHRGDFLAAAEEYLTGIKRENQLNQEIWVLRGKVAGEFNFNLHLYSCRMGDIQYDIGEPLSLPVEVSLIRLNPDYVVLHREVVELTSVWEEKTVLNFTLDQNGVLTEKNKFNHTLVKARQ